MNAPGHRTVHHLISSRMDTGHSAVNRVLTRLKWNQLRQTHLNRRNAAEIIRPIGHGVQGRLVIGERALSVQFVSTLRDAAGS